MKALCAICDRTLATQRLCADCRSDPINAEWDEGDEREHVGYIDEIGHARGTLADLARTAPGRRSAPGGLRHRILELIATRTIQRPYFLRPHKYARAVLLEWRSEPLSLHEVAYLLNTSVSHVCRTVRAAIGER
jgi:hypothetical protein